MTEFEETLEFSKANEAERDEIYRNIGFRGINRLEGDDETVVSLKNGGVDVIVLNDKGRRQDISEQICDYRYSYRLIKKFPVTLYSDFENKIRGIVEETSATTLFYFFKDAVVSVLVSDINSYLFRLHNSTDFDNNIESLIEAFIESDVHGKEFDQYNNIEIRVEPEDGHHRVDIFFETEEAANLDIEVTEYYFEEEEEEEGEGLEEEIEEEEEPEAE